MDRTPPLRWDTPPLEVHPGQSRYPPRLQDLARPPAPLRVLGSLAAVVSCEVAIVGTRRASEGALEFTFDLARDLAHQGLTIVSGGALGIDAAAHEGALAGGGKTVAVLASGLKVPYPPTHGPLFLRILSQGGALVSEAKDHWSPRRGLFLRRNRLIAALAGATVVVEAPLRSGALSTARWAMQLKRQLFCVPGSPWEARAQGGVQLLRQGGAICTSARDVLSVRPSHGPDLAHIGAEPTDKCNGFKELTGQMGSVFRCVWQQPAHPDRIARALDISADRVQELLLSLELSGLVRRRTDGSYSAVTARA